jgi:hypothetical protein
MAHRPITTKAQLNEDINRSWTELNHMLDHLSEDQLTNLHDPQGWSVKDHISHMAAWERSAVYFLEGKPRHEGVGVPEDLYMNASEDDINASVRDQKKHLSLDQARAELNDIHNQLLNLLAPMSDTDLHLSYNHFLPDEPGNNDSRPAYDVIYSNSANHFAEHAAWIKSLVASAR